MAPLEVPAVTVMDQREMKFIFKSDIAWKANILKGPLCGRFFLYILEGMGTEYFY